MFEFSLNRFGSTYRVINQEAVEMIEGVYTQKAAEIQIQEINAVEIEDSTGFKCENNRQS